MAGAALTWKSFPVGKHSGVLAQHMKSVLPGPFGTRPDSRRLSHRAFLHALLARGATHVGIGIGILLLDYRTGPLLMFPILFTIPVVLSAWLCSAGLAYALAVLLPVGRFLIAAFVDVPQSILADAANGLIRIMVLCFLAFLVARIARQERQIKVLHGLLPICMFCKRILDDRTGWQRLETYIAQHSEAEFSHGLCPECAKEKQGELLNKQQTPMRESS
jgi:hypothetical protein